MIATLPEALSRAIEAELDEHDPGAIRAATAGLSAAYRGQRAIARTLSPVERAAYLAVRFPSTFATAAAVWGELATVCDLADVRTVLDVGAGPGTASLAAIGLPPGTTFSSLERDSGWRPIAERLAAAIDIQSTFRTGALPGAIAPHDVIVAGYALNELPETARNSAIANLWSAARIALIVLEPGTPKGFAVCEAARTIALAAGAHAAAPCTHNERCPMTTVDWCHQPLRVARSAIHQSAKLGSLSYEDEKFSYVVLTRKPPVRIAPARIVRKPIRSGGHVHLDLCNARGLQRTTVARSDKEHYRDARDAEWGSVWPPSQIEG
jgi:ribosomal protein RSM22 (predicted rRNA methylase)